MLALIPGRANGGAFIQVVTAERAYNIPYDLDAYQKSGCAEVQIGNSRFLRSGAELNIQTERLFLTGSLQYHNPTPIAYDIMGPFRYLPMECRHSVVSMDHELEGVDAERQGDRLYGRQGIHRGRPGRSFPDRYVWVQCNCFDEPCSVMASVARIPFAGMRFGAASASFLAGEGASAGDL